MKKNSTSNSLFYEFCEWIIGIFEEDPLPFEITTLYFFYGKINNMIYVKLMACEIDKGSNSDFTYNPLEAQFFYSANLFNLYQNQPLINLRKFLEISIKKIKQNENLKFLKQINIKIKQANYYF